MTSNTAAAQRSWEAENNIIPIDPVQNALYTLPDHAEYQKLLNASPWKKDPHYFTSVRISALALLKMTLHARSGTPLEIMGLMTGYVSDRSLIITDAFRLPVEGTETRVNAQAEADEYQVNFGIASREGGGQMENPIGWYHSHPGYGCWLSGIDVGTQKQQQLVLDPFVAVVIDPDRTVSAGRVEIGAFRTFRDDYKPPKSVGDDSDDFQTIPTGKIEDFGAHASSYYALEVQHFKSTLDTHLLGLLWNKYWVSTLSQSPLFTNRDYGNAQIKDHALKIKDAARKQKGHGQMIGGRNVNELVGTGSSNIRMAKNASLEQVVKGGDKIAAEEMAGLMASDVKMKLFQGVVEEARARAAQQQQQQQQTNGKAAAASG